MAKHTINKKAASLIIERGERIQEGKPVSRITKQIDKELSTAEWANYAPQLNDIQIEGYTHG